MNWNSLSSQHLFRDRTEAGQILGRQLSQYADQSDLLVLALPRGGVPVGYEVAKALNAPLDVFQVRKLGVPAQEELAMGAVASGGIKFINTDVIELLHIPQMQVDEAIVRESRELERRDRDYRQDRPLPRIKGKSVILVDDGLATGSTMRAAAEAILQQGPKQLIVAVPTGAPETYQQLSEIADDVVCATAPEPFHAVGLWYAYFPQTTDQEVCDLLAQAASRHPIDRLGNGNHGIYHG